MDKLLIRGGTVIDTSRAIQEKLDILVVDGSIAEVSPDISVDGAREIDAGGLVCAPGLVDLHVHLREPGQEYKEDILSGCRAAAAGGVTSLFCMPNTVPAVDSPEIIQHILRRAEQADAHVYPVAAVTSGLQGEVLTDMEALKQAGAAAFSDDGRPVATAAMMMEAIKRAEELNTLVMSHCEELSLINGGLLNDGAVSRSLGLPGLHRAAEDVAIARDIALAEATGCRVHICHISTGGGVAMLRDARRRGVRVTGETAPHYFMLTDEALTGRDADFRMNPPLRTAQDVEAVIQGLCDGTLSAIATDHAPHSPQEKSEFIKSPNGVVGMETTLAAGITALVRTGKMSLAALMSLLSEQPARLAGIPAGTLAVGAAADIVLFDPEEQWVVQPDKLHGKSRNTPFKGMTMTGRVKTTILGGRTVYTDC